ncbi:MAG: hypothetical protein ACR2KT_02645 [Methylocella sp.]
MMEVATPTVTAAVFKASPRRDGLASFDKGAWRMLPDMIALVHQGEMLIPAGPTATFRGMMGGSSGVARTVHGHHLLASHLPTAVSLPC